MKRAGYFLAGILALALLAPVTRADEPKDAKGAKGDKNGGAAPKEAPKEKKIPDEVKKFFEKQYSPQKHGLKDARITMPLGGVPQLSAMAPDAKVVFLWKAPDLVAATMEGFPSEGPMAQAKGQILQGFKQLSSMAGMGMVPPTLEDMAKKNSFTAEKDGDNTKITMTSDDEDARETVFWADKDQKLVKVSTKQGIQSSEGEVTSEMKDDGYVITNVKSETPMGTMNSTFEYEKVEGIWMRKTLVNKPTMGEGQEGPEMRFDLTNEINKGVTEEEIKKALEEAEGGGPVSEDEDEGDDHPAPPKKGPEKKGSDHPKGDSDGDE